MKERRELCPPVVGYSFFALYAYVLCLRNRLFVSSPFRKRKGIYAWNILHFFSGEDVKKTTTTTHFYADSFVVLLVLLGRVFSFDPFGRDGNAFVGRLRLYVCLFVYFCMF
ncbi:unnamed protein product [Ectocarpus sp. 12 AP-2014]